MADNLEQLETWVGGMIAALEPAERRKLAVAIARDLKRANVRRISAQQDPDGAAFEPRKQPPARSRSGSIRRRTAGMFQKLRGPSYLGHEATADEVSVGFRNAIAARVARVHHEGLVDNVTRAKDSPRIRYPARRLLGFGDGDREQLIELIVAHLT